MIDIDKPQYEHSKIGNLLYKICAKWSKFLVKYRWLYYLLACTWGLLMTIIGLVVSGILGIAKLFTKKIRFKKFCWLYGINVGPDFWGGLEFGLCFLRDHKSSDHVSKHEFRLPFQICLCGALTPFIITIPSAIRWWYVYLKFTRKGLPYPKPYDAMWFEDSATMSGYYAYSIICPDENE